MIIVRDGFQQPVTIRYLEIPDANVAQAGFQVMLENVLVPEDCGAAFLHGGEVDVLDKIHEALAGIGRLGRETERDVKQGSTTLLATTYTCYNGSAAPCNTTAINLPITRRTVTKQLPDGSGKVSKTDAFYNTYGLVTEVDDYDYGSGAPGSLVRKTLITYSSLGNGIVDRPATSTVQDGGGSTKAQTSYSYDQTAVTATSGTPQHIAVTGSRGNPTTVTYLVQGTSTLSRTFTYYDTGTVQTATDANGASTTYTYGTGSCGNSFVTSVSLPLSLSRSMAWNCTGGVVTSLTDENNQTTTFIYNDPYFWRINSTTDPASNVTNLTYTGATASESSLVFNGGSSTVDVLKTLDGLGRIRIAQQKQAPSASNYDSVETDYDSLGRPSRVTLPYGGTAGQTNALAPGVTTAYDALGRPTQVADSGGGTVTFSYTQNDVLRTVGPAPTGENTKRRQFEYDALGRLTSVCEITSASGSGTCAQTVSQTGYWTKYTYDVLENLIGVTQNAQSGTPQTRSYSYDGLSRLTSETNPESGTVSYFYDNVASPCGGSSPGDMTKRVDAAGNINCYYYDALHRVTDIGYAGPTCWRFRYDSITVNGVAMANAKGRLAEAATDNCASTRFTDEGFSYNARGELTDVYQSTPNSGGYYHVNATFWAHGALNQLSGLPGLPTLTYTPDGEGRPAIVSASTGQNPVLSTTYNVASQPTQVSLGSSDSDSFSYDANTGRMTQYKYNVNAQSVIGNLGWNANSTLASLNITDPFNTADTQNCTYSYDDVGRIASVNCAAVWSQTFSYDVFGNIAKSGSMSFQPTYSPTTNRMTSLPGFTPSYDANGNVLNDSFHSYTWDVNGHPVTVDAVGLTYDALGRMVEQNRSGVYTQIVYGPTGEKLALMNGQTLQNAFVPEPGNGTAVYNASGLSYYRHPDWLGSSRFASTPARAMYSSVAYAPFSEPYAQSGTTDLSFTGQNQDTVGGLYDFQFREHSIQGRWPSPDPAGLAAVDLGDPQSLDRYAYVRNNPLGLVDPLGLGGCDTITCVIETGGGGFGSGFGGSLFGGGDMRPRPTPDRDDCMRHPCRYPGDSNPWTGGNSSGPANNFTLGVRAPGQTFNDCMKANAGNYSLLGVADFALDANGQIANNFWLGFTPASNTVTNVYNAVTGSLASLLQTGPTIVTAGMGTVVTSGRRTSSIMNLNLAGTPGGPKGGFPALGSAPSNAARAAKVAAGALKLAIDTGFFLAEGVGCAIPMNP